MRALPKIVAGFLPIISLLGCSTRDILPTEVPIEKSRVYAAPFDQVWTAIIGVIAESNLNITTLERASGIIAISDVSYEPGWASEGKRGGVLGAPNQVTQRLATFNVIATRPSTNQTRVQVNSSFKMQIQTGDGSEFFPIRYSWEKAYSNGTLERTILEGISRRLGPRP